ncbi:hypothetical protein VFPFJ_04623 [Purpureocillium lilacinum]|uniref:Uncharacterized protein n=1 Tax=Purpureocillium lilacinum TaxID=33203 RepID=A0A179HM69_PURLI|nr:hypothetical protein VFPFJ_04623 [Purpureocillium lilacinum]OAQ90463.1 hypothetical protein VFPFJ_04623 [Purpureocillium lilacinum]GJN78300.1 hypothetical protein PLIIFM63780_001793 [Purpureocillium lilacinum]
MKLTLFSIAALCAPAVLGAATRPTEVKDHDRHAVNKHPKPPCKLDVECQEFLSHLHESGAEGGGIAAEAGEAQASNSWFHEFSSGQGAAYAKCEKQLTACGYDLSKFHAKEQDHHKGGKGKGRDGDDDDEEESEDEEKPKKERKKGKKNRKGDKDKDDDKKDKDEDKDEEKDEDKKDEDKKAKAEDKE